MSAQRWMIAFSPDGAARTVSNHVANEFAALPEISSKTFDTLAYRQTFSRLLKENNDELIVDLLNQSLIVSCLEFRATHLLVLALAPVTLFSLNLMRGHGLKTIHWLYEDFRRAQYWKDVVAGYDHFCAIQKGPLPDTCRTAGSVFHFLPTATAAISRTAATNMRNYDVAFIGIPSPYRIALLEKLAKNNFKLAIAGSGWQAYSGILQQYIINDKWTSEEESFALLSQSRIGLNCSVNVPDPETHVSPRVYDVIAAGCILVTEKVPLLSEYLPEVTLLTFDSPETACTVIEKALSDYQENLPFLESNHQIVMTSHTYRQRVASLLTITR